MDILPDRLKILHQKNKLTQTSVAVQTGISQTHLSKMIKGKSKTTDLTLFKLCLYFNVKPGFLLGDSNSIESFCYEEYMFKARHHKIIIFMAFYNVSKKDVCNFLNVSRSSIEIYLKGKRRIPRKIKYPLFDYLNSYYKDPNEPGITQEDFPICPKKWLLY